MHSYHLTIVICVELHFYSHLYDKYIPICKPGPASTKIPGGGGGVEKKKKKRKFALKTEVANGLVYPDCRELRSWSVLSIILSVWGEPRSSSSNLCLWEDNNAVGDKRLTLKAAKWSREVVQEMSPADLWQVLTVCQDFREGRGERKQS